MLAAAASSLEFALESVFCSIILMHDVGPKNRYMKYFWVASPDVYVLGSSTKTKTRLDSESTGTVHHNKKIPIVVALSNLKTHSKLKTLTFCNFMTWSSPNAYR